MPEPGGDVDHRARGRLQAKPAGNILYNRWPIVRMIRQPPT
jgi:hypothetical protein